MPPWGLWPAAFIGVAWFDQSLTGRPILSRFSRGILVGLSWALPSTFWMVDLTPPGWLIAAFLHSGFIGLAAVLVPPFRGRRLGLIGTICLAEFVRWKIPFGGIPLASIPIGQVSGPLASIVRLAGPLLLVALVVAIGCSLSSLFDRLDKKSIQSVTATTFFVALALIVAEFSPSGHSVGNIEAAVVQGGGPQRTRATPTGAVTVFNNQITATNQINNPVDLIVWPENVVNPDLNISSKNQRSDRLYIDEARSTLTDLTNTFDATLVVGWFHQDPVDKNVNLNYVEAIKPGGRVTDRFDKVRTVPFGEFVPMRSFIERFAGSTLPKRDVRPGNKPAILQTPLGRLGIMISWEVFFTERAREAAQHDALVLLNPTNGASYWLTQVQTQQVASSRLRAMETGRWILQAAPTGFSAIIDHNGQLLERTGISEQAVRQATVDLREGRTWATQVGPWPMLVVIALLILTGKWSSYRKKE